MPGISAVVREIVHLYRLDGRSRVNKYAMKERKLKVRMCGPRAERLLAHMFVIEAVEGFVKNTKLSKRDARRYYTGAFAFASKSYIKGTLLKVCLAAAQREFRAGNHEVVWRFVAIAHTYRPDSLDAGYVDELFERVGVRFGELLPPADNEPLGRRWTVAHLLAASFAQVH